MRKNDQTKYKCKNKPRRVINAIGSNVKNHKKMDAML